MITALVIFIVGVCLAGLMKTRLIFATYLAVVWLNVDGACVVGCSGLPVIQPELDSPSPACRSNS